MIPNYWAHFVLLEINGKRPIQKNWRSIRPTKDDIADHQGNLGWVIPPGVLVVDCDLNRNAQKSHSYLTTNQLLHPHPTVRTPHGHHTYLRLPESIQKFPNKISKFEGIDFLTFGAYVIIPPSKIDTLCYTWVDTKLDVKLCSEELSRYGINLQENENDTSWSIDQTDETLLRSWLRHIDPGIDYHTWVRVGFALHNWHLERGLFLWTQWSKWKTNIHKKYTEGECEIKWAGFGGRQDYVTVATIKYIASQSLRSKIETRLAQPISVEQKQTFTQEISESTVLTNEDQQIILEQLVQREIADDGKPEIFKDGVYDALAHVFLITRYGPLNKDDFNQIFKSYGLPHKKPCDVVIQLKYVSTVWGRCYIPNEPKIIEINRIPQVNMYDPNSIPDIVCKPIHEKYIKRILAHLLFLTGSEFNRDFLLDWISHQVQHTGKKLTWAPFIQSVQGVGKTFIIRLMRAILGSENVGVVRPTDLINRFNGWAIGSAVTIFDEIKIPKRNRDEIDSFVNKIVSDMDVTIEKKGQDIYSTRNTTNYLALTNHKNALHFRGYERRWWVVFCPIKDIKEEIKEQFKIDHDTYFEKLHECLDFPGQLRKYFLEREISHEFSRTIRAPITKDYEEIVVQEKRLLPGYEEAELLLLQGNGVWYNKRYIVTKEFFKDLLFTDQPLDIRSPYSKARILQELGYEASTQRLYFGGEQYNLYTKGHVSMKYINQQFFEYGRQLRKKGE